MATLKQEHFRFRTDVGAVDGTPAWGAAEDAAIGAFTPNDAPFRLRVSISNFAASDAASQPYELYLSKNGAGFAAITTSSTGGVKSSSAASSDSDNTILRVPRLTTPVRPLITYVGPGDIIGSALAWYGLRAYNADYAAGGTSPAIDIVDSGGTNQTTINILATGALDGSTLDAWITAHGTASIKKCYDQSGNGVHLTQSTVVNMPTIVQNGLGSFSVVKIDYNAGGATGQKLTSAATITQAQPFHGSVVANRFLVDTGGGRGVLSTSSAIAFLSWANAINTARLNDAGGAHNFDVTQTDGAWHAFQSVFNGASPNSIGVVDGSVTTGTFNTTGLAGDTIQLGSLSGNPCVSYFAEGGIWGGAAWGTGAGGTAQLMNTNQHNYWGF